jgi:hypothetical protein
LRPASSTARVGSLLSPKKSWNADELFCKDARASLCQTHQLERSWNTACEYPHRHNAWPTSCNIYCLHTTAGLDGFHHTIYLVSLGFGIIPTGEIDRFYLGGEHRSIAIDTSAPPKELIVRTAVFATVFLMTQLQQTLFVRRKRTMSPGPVLMPGFYPLTAIQSYFQTAMRSACRLQLNLHCSGRLPARLR